MTEQEWRTELQARQSGNGEQDVGMAEQEGRTTVLETWQSENGEQD